MRKKIINKEKNNDYLYMTNNLLTLLINSFYLLRINIITTACMIVAFENKPFDAVDAAKSAAKIAFTETGICLLICIAVFTCNNLFHKKNMKKWQITLTVFEAILIIYQVVNIALMFFG